jgi:Na+/proline symporter
VLSFGYWTTNFAEVQRALAARNLSAARRTPLIAAVTVQGLGAKTGDLQFNNAIPILISKYLPSGMLGVAITGLLAAFMAGVAANVTAFNHRGQLRPVGGVPPQGRTGLFATFIIAMFWRRATPWAGFACSTSEW